MIPAATREAQAMACLEAADKHRQPLLAVATNLTRCADLGMNLYQQNLLNCHDAIQRNGFAGERYEFYLFSSLKRLHYKLDKKRRQETELPEHFDTTYAVAPEPNVADRQLLAEQMQAQACASFSPADRIVLRLHVDGYSCQDIADMTGRHGRQWVWRRLEKMKDSLRETFAQAWAALLDAPAEF